MGLSNHTRHLRVTKNSMPTAEERIINGEIVTDSESENPELYYKEQEKALRKKIESIKHSAKRRSAKRIANQKYL